MSRRAFRKQRWFDWNVERWLLGQQACGNRGSGRNREHVESLEREYF
jgi:hypothetical protein